MVRARACESAALTPAPASAEFLSSLPFCSSLGGSSSSSHERPPAAVPAGPEARRGAGSRGPEPAARLPGLDRARGRRRRRRGSRRAAAERAAAGTVCKLPALAGPRAARPHSARAPRGSSSGALRTRAGGILSAISPKPPLLDLSNFSGF